MYGGAEFWRELCSQSISEIYIGVPLHLYCVLCHTCVVCNSIWLGIAWEGCVKLNNYESLHRVGRLELWPVRMEGLHGQVGHLVGP